MLATNTIEIEIDKYNTITLRLPTRMKPSEFFALLDRTKKILNIGKVSEIENDIQEAESTEEKREYNKRPMIIPLTRNQLKQEKYEAIYKDFQSGMNYYEVSEKYKMNKSQLYYIINIMQKEKGDRSPLIPHAKRANDQPIISDYCNKMGMAAIKKKHHVSHPMLQAILWENGLCNKKHHENPNWSDEKREEVYNLILRGKTTEQIADDLNIPAYDVKYHILILTRSNRIKGKTHEVIKNELGSLTMDEYVERKKLVFRLKKQGYTKKQICEMTKFKPETYEYLLSNRRKK